MSGYIRVNGIDNETPKKMSGETTITVGKLPQIEVCKVYKIRWIILLIFVLYSASNAMQWVQYSIIADVIVKYYGVSYTFVDWTSMIYMVLYIPFIFPGSYMLDKLGLRVAVLIGITGTCLGSWIKVASVAPDRFWVGFLGQSIVAFSQVFILSVPARLAAVWFGPSQVSSACSIGVFGNQVVTEQNTDSGDFTFNYSQIQPFMFDNTDLHPLTSTASQIFNSTPIELEISDEPSPFHESHGISSTTELPSLTEIAAHPESITIPEVPTRILTPVEFHNVDRTIARFGEIVQEPLGSVENITSCRSWTKKNTCPYCMNQVTHFSRHLIRNHGDEGAVKEIMSLDNKDPKKNKLITVIRRQGNLLFSEKINCVQPVRRPKQVNTLIKDDYTACQFCFGLFKKEFLRRHRKKCKLRPNDTLSSDRENHLTQSQIFAVCSGAHQQFYNRLRLKSEVFTIMRADKISQIAMKDFLICSYAESQLLKHKRVQIKTTISNKMRELGRLLIALSQTTGLKTLFEALKPEFFDNFVSATKNISGYDPSTRTFTASSLALHMGTTLKQVCDIATKMIFKKSQYFQCEDAETRLKEIKRLRSLVENHWGSEISSLALKNLNEKQWEKPKLLPVTSDLMHFQNYITKEAKDASEKVHLKNNLQKEYRRLSENIMALVLLLNRKRIGEIQYLKCETYCKEGEDISNQQQDFWESLSEAEKILTKNFKRVVSGGKGSKPVPILFPKNVQEMIAVMLKFRNECVPSSNEYLFANPNTKNSWLSGYHVLKKLADRAGVQNKDLFTSTRLRKQIASVLQVLNVTENEIEQFATFMGHTKKTHKEFYRLPQDVYQTAKVSKLLLAVSKGQGAKYKGKTLDEIELTDLENSDCEQERKPKIVNTKTNKSPLKSNKNPLNRNRTKRISYSEKISDNGAQASNSGKSDIESSEGSKISDCDTSSGSDLTETSKAGKSLLKNIKNTRDSKIEKRKSNCDTMNDLAKTSKGSKMTPASRTSKKKPNSDSSWESNSADVEPPKKKQKVIRVRWTEEQKQRIQTHFSHHIKHKIAPKKNEVEEFIMKHSSLYSGRNWVVVKAFVYNLYKNT